MQRVVEEGMTNEVINRSEPGTLMARSGPAPSLFLYAMEAIRIITVSGKK